MASNRELKRSLHGTNTAWIVDQAIDHVPHTRSGVDCAVIAHAFLSGATYPESHDAASAAGYDDGFGMWLDADGGTLIKFFKDQFPCGRMVWYVDVDRSASGYLNDHPDFTGIMIMENAHDDGAHVVPVISGIAAHMSADHWYTRLILTLKVRPNRLITVE